MAADSYYAESIALWGLLPPTAGEIAIRSDRGSRQGMPVAKSCQSKCNRRLDGALFDRGLQTPQPAGITRLFGSASEPQSEFLWTTSDRHDRFIRYVGYNLTANCESSF